MEQQRICCKCSGKTNTLADFVSLDLVSSPDFNFVGLGRQGPEYKLRGFGGVEVLAKTPRNPDAQL
jgi:hypothetical protein